MEPSETAKRKFAKFVLANVKRVSLAKHVMLFFIL